MFHRLSDENKKNTIKNSKYNKMLLQKSYQKLHSYVFYKLEWVWFKFKRIKTTGGAVDGKVAGTKEVRCTKPWTADFFGKILG